MGNVTVQLNGISEVFKVGVQVVPPGVGILIWGKPSMRNAFSSLLTNPHTSHSAPVECIAGLDLAFWPGIYI